MALFAFFARNGRLMLVAGLLVGIALPDLALFLRPAIAPMIVALLFLAVLRLGPQGLKAGLSGLRGAAVLALVLQLALPLAAAALFALAGILTHPLATGVVLALAAAPITGSPNITLMVFFVMPAFGSPLGVARAALELLAVIAVAGGVATALRSFGIVRGTTGSILVMDGLAALLLGLVVIGLMSAMGPALWNEPGDLALALGVVFALNIPLQLLASSIARRSNPEAAPGIGIVAGNRNLALFLSVLPPATVDQLLLFVGCFQVPMYLTPFVLARWYRRRL
jgi:ACR3 family arsenite transporter